MADGDGATGAGQGNDGQQQQGQLGQSGDGQGQQAQGAAPQASQQVNQQQGQAATGDDYLAQRFPGWATFPDEAKAALRARDAEARRYQSEAGDKRIEAKNAAAQDGARKALAEAAKLAGLEIPGLTDTDKGDGDPRALAQTITTVTGERDAARLDLITVQQAVAAGVDMGKLDYLRFKLSQSAEFRQIDANAATAGDTVRASIDAALAQDATLRATGTVQASGVENLGGSGGGDTITKEQWAGMSVMDKQNVFLTDKPLYDRMVAAQ